MRSEDMIALIDYDAGNMKSVEKALQLIGEDVLVTRDPKEILAADKVVLPGVGSFGDAMENLHHFGLVPVIHQVVQEQTPFLGICLGLQLLFEKSEESRAWRPWHLKRRDSSDSCSGRTEDSSYGME